MAADGSAAAQRDAADEELEAWMLRLLGDEGLSWLPDEPWAAPWGRNVLLFGERPGETLAEVSWAQRGTLMGLLSRFLATRDERYLDAAKRLADGLRRIALVTPDGCYFPEGYYPLGGWHVTQAGLCPGLEETNAAAVAPLVRLWEICGWQPALGLAEGLARYALRHTQGYAPDGSMLGAGGTILQAHFHTRSAFILAVLKLGLALDRPDYVAWAERSYRAAQAWGTEFGWFPEHLGQRHGEVCGIVDMIEIALLLGRRVDRRYYADAERYGRNHLLGCQWLSEAQLRAAVEALPPSTGAGPHGGRFSTRDDVIARQAGGFASRPALNDAFHLDATDLMQCCNASGARGLYDLWRYAVEDAPGGDPPETRIHLRLSVETPALRVVSHEPTAGRLEIATRAARRVAVRLPEGVAEARLDGAAGERTLPAIRGYIAFETTGPETAVLHYALPERVAHYEAGAGKTTARCTARWRGESVASVDPAGPIAPLYRRPLDLPPVSPRPAAGPIIESL